MHALALFLLCVNNNGNLKWVWVGSEFAWSVQSFLDATRLSF